MGDIVNNKGAISVESFGAAESFVQSEVFARTFKEGMALVEDTANYLDGEGRDAAKALSKTSALAYAGASMRLTTQLMQIASWLLVLRAVREGDMASSEAWEDKYRLPLKERTKDNNLDAGLPQTLNALIDASNQLYDRIGRLDADLFQIASEPAERGDAAAQQQALLNAFQK